MVATEKRERLGFAIRGTINHVMPYLCRRAAVARYCLLRQQALHKRPRTTPDRTLSLRDCLRRDRWIASKAMEAFDTLTSAPLLAVANLEVGMRGCSARLLDIGGMAVGAGETVGVMGAPGAGKTLLARTIMGLLPPNLAIARGSIRWLGEEISIASERRLERLRGRTLGIMFQSPEQALDPLRSCFCQLAEPFRNSGIGRAEMTAKFAADLRRLGFANPDRVLWSRPGALSGGERQRLLFAIATAQRPALLIADEPTSGLDAELRSELVDMVHARAQAGLATLLISHDRTVMERAAHRVIHMEAGQLVETPPPRPALPRQTSSRNPRTPLLDVSDLRIKRGRNELLRDLSFRVDVGEAVGVTGPSGTGKTSLAHVLVGLLPTAGGKIVLHAMRPDQHPQAVQLIHQDPSSSLNPSMIVGEAIVEPMLLRGLSRKEAEDCLRRLLTSVGLSRELVERRPDALSGGQLQLAAIARAIAADPALLVLDEPTASLSEAAAVAVLNLLHNLLKERCMGAIIISHDVALVRAFCEKVVMLGSPAPC